MKPCFSVILLFGTTLFLLFQGCTARRTDSASIRVRWAHDPETIDPLQLTNQMALDAASLLHLSLMQIDLSTGEFAAALVEGPPTTRLLGDSLMQLSYRLRPGAQWDGGLPVLASDVAFTLRLMFCPGLPNETPRLRFNFIRRLIPDPADPRHFKLECRGQSPEYVQASGDFFILSEAALDPQHSLRRFSLADLQARPVSATPDTALEAVGRRYRNMPPDQLPGCGPYRLAAWEKDRYLTFRRKPRWWADRLRAAPFVLRARPVQLDFLIIPDATTASLALQRGELDVFPQVPAREFARLRTLPAAKAALAFYSRASYDVVTVAFNTRRPALADALTRRALSRCFDAAGLLQATQLGEGQRSVGIISPTDRRYYNDSLAPVPFDPAGAAALLHQAGWQRAADQSRGWFRPGPHGEREALQLRVRYRANESMFATIALQFQAAAAGLGIAVALQPTESGVLSETLRQGDFDLCIRTLKGNPFMFNFMPLLHSHAVGAGNITGFGTPASDRLLEAMEAANLPVHKAVLLRRFQAMMQTEAPMIPLFFLPTRIAADRRLRGLHVSGLKPGYTAAGIERLPTASVP